jgi:hypothetical protein
MNSSPRKSHLLRAALWAMCAGPIAVFAAEQTPRSGRSDPSPAQRPKAIDSTRGGQPFPATPEEWARTAQFMEENAPQRFRVYLSSKDAPRKHEFEQFLVNRWRRLEELKAQSPELYDVRTNEIKLNDQVFALCQQIKSTNGPQKQKLQDELKRKVAELFDNGLSERRLRISQLQERLKKQTQALESDTRKRDELISKRYRQISVQGVPGARLDNSRNPIIEPPSEEEIEIP